VETVIHFFRILTINGKLEKKQLLLEIEIYCKIINVFTVNDLYHFRSIQWLLVE